MADGFGAEVRRRREHLGMSLRELARRAPLDAGHLSRLEAGRRQPTREAAIALDAALHAGGDLVALAAAPPLPWPLTADGWGRRDAEALANALTTITPTVDNAARLAQEWLITEPPQLYEMRAGRRIGVATVDRVERRVHQLRRLDDHAGGATTYTLVSAELAATANLLRTASYTEPVARRLLTVLGELTQLAGFVAADIGRTAEATRLYVAGMRAAHAAGDRAGAANNLGSLAYHVANTGDPREAPLLARTAAAGAAHHRSATAVALQWERVAWAHARAGDDRAAGRALATVEDTYGRRHPDDDPPWAYWLTPDEVDVMAGRVWTQLQRPLRAVPILQRAVASYGADTGRETALYLTWLAEALLQAREVEQAVDVATRALRLASRAGSARAVERVAVIRGQLADYAGTPAVDAFEDECQSHDPTGA